jgi:hypothetical protein
MNQNERKARIIARGEHSGHSHIITGEAVVRNEFGEILIDVIGKCSIEHLMEDAWLQGESVHTKEHEPIPLEALEPYIRQGDVFLEKIGEKTYRYIQQKVFDPLTKRIEAARD